MTRHTIRALAAAGLAAAALVTVPGTALAQYRPAAVTAEADVDGDGAQEHVTLEQLAPGTQLLRVHLPSGYVEDRILGDEGLPLIVPFVVDVNGDGRDELVIATSLGANTNTLQLWSFDDDRLHAVTTEDGATWQLFEGGGVSAMGMYGCVPGTPARQLRDVQATLDEAASTDGTTRYDGTAVTYTVTDGMAHRAVVEPLEDVTRDDPRVQVDPATCATVA
ncbi:hypothetical protein [Pseudonocardia zijingensis]|jgi:hypothetical protein|uniref:VCBS repeat protein n=1 Tax=Pseudonocardia zijingensis TaxID=153376 RepID=A0ABN1N9G2_9PSEU